MWADLILGDHRHIQHHHCLMPYDDVDGVVAEGLDDGLPVEHGVQLEPHPEVEPKPALSLGCRWRVPLTRVLNPSGVLLLYRDQLDTQTFDQVYM